VNTQPEQSLEVPADAGNAATIRLLVVDGNPGYSGAMSEILRRHSRFDCIHCSEPAKALDLATQIEPAVILQAITLPDVDSLGLVRCYREIDGLVDVPVIIIFSADDEPVVKDAIFSAGADDYFSVLSSEKEIVSRLNYHARVCAERRSLLAAVYSVAEARKQLMRSEKMATIGQLAAGVAHEINNPVAFVASNINSMSDDYDDVFEVISAYEKLEETLPAEHPGLRSVQALKEQRQIPYLKKDIEQIIAECKDGMSRIQKIIEDLKIFSRDGEIVPKLTDINRDIESTLNIARNELKYKAEVVRNYGELPQVECVATQINQVILNLLVNAAQAIEDHGTITINTSVETDDVETHGICIRIADTGCGIDTENLSCVFEPFYTTKPIGAGTGLGLSLSRQIILEHGGRLEVESEPGQGTTFTIWLPVQKPERQED
jgi:signal transduction histidine kinase